MAEKPITLTSRGVSILVNPQQIVYVEPNGSHGTNVYLTNREYKQVEESVELVNTLWRGVSAATIEPAENTSEHTDATKQGLEERRARKQQPSETK